MIAYCFTRLRVSFDYLEFWDIEDLNQFIECYKSVEENGRKTKTTKTRTYTEDDLDQL